MSLVERAVAGPLIPTVNFICFRLSEANLQGIGSEIEEMYRHQSRAYVSEAITDIILNACIAPTLVPERLIMEHVMLVALLHNNVGSEVGRAAVHLLFYVFYTQFTS